MAANRMIHYLQEQTSTKLEERGICRFCKTKTATELSMRKVHLVTLYMTLVCHNYGICTWPSASELPADYRSLKGLCPEYKTRL